MIVWEQLDSPYKDQMLILKRICVRGRTYMLDKNDGVGLDLFEHIETEIGRLAVELAKDNHATDRPEGA